jgi:Ca2+-binding RTX toxin-like protein
MATTLVSSLTTRASALTVGSNDALFITTGGHLVVTAGHAVTQSAATDSYMTIIVHGELSALAGAGVSVALTNPSGGADVTVGAEGVITALTAGIYVSAAASAVINGGTITAGERGIDVLGDASTVANSGTVIADGSAIAIDGADSAAQNAGTLFGLTGITVGFGSTGATVTNSGTIIASTESSFDESRGMNVYGDGNTLSNTGRIESEDTGIRISGGTTASTETLFNGGFVIAGDTALQTVDGTALDRVLVTNSGTLQGGTLGVEHTTAGRLFLTNLAGGQIVAMNGDAVRLADATGGSRVENFGTIASSFGDAVDVSAVTSGGGLTLVNHGLVEGAVVGGAMITFLRNFGTMDLVSLGAANDQVRNGGFIDAQVLLGAGNDLFNGRGGTVEGTIDGGRNDDTLIGGAGDDTMTGGAENDSLTGNGGDDSLLGSVGNDTLAGGADNDRLNGGAGTDVLEGGNGADRFVFSSGADAGLGLGADRIADFEQGEDRIDLSALSPTAFIGKDAFSLTAGEVRYVKGTGILSGDVNGDGAADWEVLILNRPAVAATDLIL